MIGNLKRAAEAKVDPEAKAWAKAKEEGTIDAFEAFLLDFPAGKHASEAIQELVKLKAAKQEPITRNEEGVAAFSAGKYEDAVKAFETSAEKGYVPGIFNLGLVHERGAGVEADPAKAAEWCKKAAELGDPDPQVNYGCMLETGEGVEKNATEAANWYAKAAAQEHGLAQYNLGVLHARGEGVSKDLDRALKLFRAAADNGVKAAPESVELIEN